MVHGPCSCAATSQSVSRPFAVSVQHEGYNQFLQTDADRATFCLPGKENQAKRLAIFSAMLEVLPDEQKLNVRTPHSPSPPTARAATTSCGIAAARWQP